MKDGIASAAINHEMFILIRYNETCVIAFRHSYISCTQHRKLHIFILCSFNGHKIHCVTTEYCRLSCCDGFQ